MGRIINLTSTKASGGNIRSMVDWILTIFFTCNKYKIDYLAGKLIEQRKYSPDKIQLTLSNVN